MKDDTPPAPSRLLESDDMVHEETQADIRCTCGRLLARLSADGTAIKIRCPRCKRTWTFPLTPGSFNPTER